MNRKQYFSQYFAITLKTVNKTPKDEEIHEGKSGDFIL